MSIEYTFLLFIQFISVYCLSDVTDNVLGRENKGVLGAFGDFNADKHTDLFIIEKGKNLRVLLASPDKSFTSKTLISGADNDDIITSVVPADFDGDAQMDILVTRQTLGQTDYNVRLQIYWGSGNGETLETPLNITAAFRDQPLLLDANGDMIPDLVGETVAGQRNFWIFSVHRNYTIQPVKNETINGSLPLLKQPQSSAFVDMDNDLTADLCYVSEGNGGQQIEIWLNQGGEFIWTRNIPFPTKLKVVGQVHYVDIDSDQKTDFLVPGCTDTECKESVIYCWQDEWRDMQVDFHQSGVLWGFRPLDTGPTTSEPKVPITLRAGDFNLDGYPDLLAVLVNSSREMQRAVLLLNKGCGEGCRTFSVEWGRWLEGPTDKPSLPVFYDVFENGILDVIVNGNTSANETEVRVFSQDFVEDAYFIKVTVVSGLCLNDCPGKREPYGVNQPGPVVRYEATSSSGDPQIGAATQLTQSAHFSLQLPYTVFGLGQTPNFVDKLDVGVPYPVGKKPRNRTWRSVIPNSQLIVIPYPLDDPGSWTNKLFVTPSRLMLLTGAALLGTCGFIAGIIGILHWRDKIEDKKEKRQEAHKFHFDAM